MPHKKKRRSKPNILSIAKSQKGRKPKAKAARRTRGQYTG
jgi:hypothetical protein